MKLSLILTLALSYAGSPGVPVSKTLQDEFKVMAQFAGAAACKKIFETQKFQCAWACSGEAAGTQLIGTSTDKLTTGAAYVALSTKLKSIIVAFRGSDRLQDWIVNFNVWKSGADFANKDPDFLHGGRMPKGARVHGGFEIQYRRIRDRILPLTLNLAKQYPDYRIIFVGHSLGGALTTLASVDFVSRHGFADRNKKWAGYVNQLPFASRMYRIHRRGDPVSYVPPRWLGYRHSLQMYQILKDGSVIKCDREENSGESLECMSGLFTLNPLHHGDYFKSPMC